MAFEPVRRPGSKLARSVAVIIAEAEPGGVFTPTPCRGWNVGLSRWTWRDRPGAGSASVTAALVGLVSLVAVGLWPGESPAAPITGESNAARGPLSTNVTVSCALNADGTTTCAVQRGRAAVCPERVPGEKLERSYLPYEYLQVEGGCTLPADYWQTHSKKGSAPFDDAGQGRDLDRRA
jgi:hypothetical protein